MSDPLESLHLKLPYLAAAQAQKHVTHNEALRRLDSLVQLAVLSASQSAPPVTLVEGDRYIVAAGATGAWAGHDGDVASYVDGAWDFAAPGTGWLAFDVAAGVLLARQATGWAAVSGGAPATVARLGINTTADDINRLAVKSAAVLFSAIEAAGGGTGDVRFTVNKETAGDSASLLFQSGWSGRAEVGLCGDDDFVFKVSPDGATWHEAIRIDRYTGQNRMAREKLGGNRTYYVRTNGSDSNDGSANDAAHAFLTIQKAINVAAALDLSIYGVTLQLAAGTYVENLTVSGPFVGLGTVTILGDTTTPANCVISATTTCLAVSNGGRVRVGGVKFTSAHHALSVDGVGSSLTISGACDFGACVNNHLAVTNGGYVSVSANYTISGPAQVHWNLDGLSALNCVGKTITITGTPAFGPCFALVGQLSFLACYSDTFVGSATGTRYIVQYNSVIHTNGGGPDYLPGSVAGSASNGGIYR